MKVCYQCGGVIRSDFQVWKSKKCTTCDVYYCNRCLLAVTRCLICGEEPDKYASGSHEPTNKNPLFSKTKVIDTRQDQREKYRTTVEYVMASETEATTSVKRVKAMSVDISSGGMCIYTKISHEEGQKLKFTESSICNGHIHAEVRWSERVGETIYKAGLKFI